MRPGSGRGTGRARRGETTRNGRDMTGGDWRHWQIEIRLVHRSVLLRIAGAAGEWREPSLVPLEENEEMPVRGPNVEGGMSLMTR